MFTHTRAALLAAVCALPFAGGCMPGMTYKMAMPSSVTLGAQKNDQAWMASSETRGRIAPVVQRASATPLDLQ